jgi:hypothetical protein
MKKLTYLAVLMILFLSSCSKDEDPNPRDQAIGTYPYTTTIYYLDTSDNTLSPLGADFDYTGTFIVSKDPNDANGILIEESGDKIKGNKIASAKNGFSFDIESQTFTSDGTTYTIFGYDGVELQSQSGSTVKYNGGYFSDSKKLQFYFQTTTQGVTIVFEFNCIKHS